MKKIYAYYQSIPLSNQSEEFACANWWKGSWTDNGWEPVMLNRSHAQASTLYNKLQQKLMSLTLGMPPELATRFDWIVARYVRWCALHAAGGGWMSDYDVVNKAFKPDIAEEYEKEGTLQVNANSSAYLFYATKEHCANAVKKFIQEPLIEGKEMMEEAHILGVTSKLYPIIPLVHHAKTTDNLQRSGVMKNLCVPDEESV
jgi:hypothetical protein